VKEGERRASLPPKCYKTHTCTGGQRERKRVREARKGGVHRHKLNVGMPVAYMPSETGMPTFNL